MSILRQKPFISYLAIYLSGEYQFDELLSVIEIFTECGRLQEAYGLYLTLMERFPHVSELMFNKTHVQVTFGVESFGDNDCISSGGYDVELGCFIFWLILCLHTGQAER
jgi:hypothetical protein